MSVWWWIGFHVVVLALLALDLGVFQRSAKTVTTKQAALWSLFWVMLSLGFNAFVYFELGEVHAQEFLSAYLLEKSLSVDNLFVFALVFGYFKVQEQYQHRILFFGILGALILRASLIAAGITLVHTFDWLIYVFGAFLVWTGTRLAFMDDSNPEIDKNPIIRLFHRLLPISDHYYGQRFFVRESGRLMATPMIVVLGVIETTDLVFALDSIPATIAVVSSKNMFIAYSSNICAILGLRALYFLLANMLDRFHLLKYGLAIVLVFIGVKMLITFFDLHIATWISLVVIAAVLTTVTVASLLFPKKEEVELGD